MDYTLYDILDSCYEWVITIIQQFRRFLLGLTAIDRDIAFFFFISVPIIFAALEIIFDWLIPTFTNLEPMGIRRFVGLRFDNIKAPEVKLYSPVKSDRLKPYKSNIRFTSSELKHYQQLYQQRYNTTASPMQLKKFAVSEAKQYSYIDRRTGISGDKLKSLAMGSASLGRGIAANYSKLQKWSVSKSEHEETPEEAVSEVQSQ